MQALDQRGGAGDNNNTVVRAAKLTTITGRCDLRLLVPDTCLRVEVDKESTSSQRDVVANDQDDENGIDVGGAEDRQCGDGSVQTDGGDGGDDLDSLSQESDDDNLDADEEDDEEIDDDDDEDDDDDGDENGKNILANFTFEHNDATAGGGNGLDEPIDIDAFGFDSCRFDIKPSIVATTTTTAPNASSAVCPETPPPSAKKASIAASLVAIAAAAAAAAANRGGPNAAGRATVAAASRRAKTAGKSPENFGVDSKVGLLGSLPPNPVTVGGAYKCKKCNNSYARLHSLNRHLRFECGVEPQFECPVCHKKSKHKHNLVLHMRTHRNDQIAQI